MNIATSQTQFDAAYKAAQPEPVQQLMAMPAGIASRAPTAAKLAQEGYLIDNAIMVWGYDPWIATQARIQLGYTWIPSLLQPPVMVAPGIAKPVGGLQIYDPQIIPAGAIPVTLDLDLLPEIFAAPTAA